MQVVLNLDRYKRDARDATRDVRESLAKVYYTTILLGSQRRGEPEAIQSFVQLISRKLAVGKSNFARHRPYLLRIPPEKVTRVRESGG